MLAVGVKVWCSGREMRVSTAIFLLHFHEYPLEAAATAKSGELVGTPLRSRGDPVLFG